MAVSSAVVGRSLGDAAQLPCRQNEDLVGWKFVSTAEPSDSNTSGRSIRSKATRCSGMTASASSGTRPAGARAGANPERGQVVSSPAKASDECAHADGEDVLALKVAPHPAELACRRDGLWSPRDEGGVERPRRGCHRQVRDDAALIHSVQHFPPAGREAPAAS